MFYDCGAPLIIFKLDQVVDVGKEDNIMVMFAYIHIVIILSWIL